MHTHAYMHSHKEGWVHCQVEAHKGTNTTSHNQQGSAVHSSHIYPTPINHTHADSSIVTIPIAQDSVWGGVLAHCGLVYLISVAMTTVACSLWWWWQQIGRQNITHYMWQHGHTVARCHKSHYKACTVFVRPLFCSSHFVSRFELGLYLNTASFINFSYACYYNAMWI